MHAAHKLKAATGIPVLHAHVLLPAKDSEFAGHGKHAVFPTIRLSMFELRETGDWDIFPGPPERARVETGGTDQWVLKRREC